MPKKNTPANPFISKHCWADNNKSFCTFYIWHTRAAYATNCFAAHSFSTPETEYFTDWTVSIWGRSQGNWVSIARQNNNHNHGAVLCCRAEGGDENVSIGLNNLIDKIHVYFLNRVPAFCKSHHCSLGSELVFLSQLLLIRFSLLLENNNKKRQQMVTLDAQTEKN